MSTSLCPAQQAAFEWLQRLTPMSSALCLLGGHGMGKTTILRQLHRSLGGAFLTLADLFDFTRSRHPLALEEAFADWLEQALALHPVVLVDDFHLLASVVGGCHFYPRSGLLSLPLTRIVERAARLDKKLVFASTSHFPAPLATKGRTVSLNSFAPDDYAHIAAATLATEKMAKLDFARIYRFATGLTGHQLRSACVWLDGTENLDTDRFIDYLRSQHLCSNVDLSEVQSVSLSDIKGVEEVVESLEANVVLPLENDELALELGLRPKRGVLLLGPPGTGKTTVGRALAHRLRGKFFLLDGTIISGTGDFYGQVNWLFEQAKQNAPSVLFIDDSDVIFESGEELGLYRYLLTMLDGLESTSAGRVCVMLTAMDVSALPPALLRSGRVELWLEMRLPGLEAREAILQAHLSPLPAALEGVDFKILAEVTEGCTGADLKRLVEDGNLLLAHDRVQQKPLRPVTDYFMEAVGVLRRNKARYAEADARARVQRVNRPVYFDVGNGKALSGTEAPQA